MKRALNHSRPSRPSLLDVERGSGPFLGASVHASHTIRQSLLPNVALSDAERLREEDPFTELWAAVCPNHIVPHRSRFEVDFNRPPTHALYTRPEDAWGLTVWKRPLDEQAIRKNMGEYRAFYAAVREQLEDLEERYGKFVVLDIHSYNHRRDGAAAAPADPALNPEINLGTGSMDRTRWGSLVERFMGDLRAFNFMGRQLDVRENVRFQGGHLSRWVHEQFPVTGCALAIEVKKFFMDEWTGEVDDGMVRAIREALQATLPGLRAELSRC